MAAQEALIEGVAKSIVRQHKDELDQLPEEERAIEVRNIVAGVNAQAISDPDSLIKFISSRHRDLTPELQERLAAEQEMVNQLQRAEGAGSPSVALQAARLNLQKSRKEKELQEIGVETGEELPTGNLELGFGVNRIETLTNVLTDHFGQNTPVFERDGEILYLDPTDEIVKKVNPNLAGAIGIGLPVAGDMIGTIGVGIISSPTGPGAAVTAETAGSTIGTSIGELLRLSTGKFMNAHDLSWDDIFKRSGIEGVKAGATTGVTGALFTGLKNMRNVFRAGKMSKKALLDTGLTTKQADTVIEEVNRILGKQKLKGTLSTRVDDMAVANTERELRDSVLYAQEFAERDLADQMALAEALEKLTRTGQKGGGAAISEVLSKKTAARIAKAKDIVVSNADQLDKKLKTIGRIGKDEVGDPTRALIQVKKDAADQAQKSAWKKVEDLGGFDPDTRTYGITIPEGAETKQLREILDRRVTTALTKTGKAQQVLAPRTSSAPTVTVKEAPKGQIRFTEPAAPKPLEDLADYNRELSKVRKDIRTLSRNPQAVDMDIAELMALKEALKNDRANHLMRTGQQDLLNEINIAETATREYRMKFENNIIGDLMDTKKSGVYKIKSKEFVDKMLKADKDEFSGLVDIISDSPSTMQAWKEGIADA